MENLFNNNFYILLLNIVKIQLTDPQPLTLSPLAIMFIVILFKYL